MNTKFILFSTLIAVFAISFAAAFSVSSGGDTSICAGTTATIIDTVLNSGNYIITSAGTASAFSTVIPSGLIVNGQGMVYSYISPPSDALPGPYNLNVKISDNAETQSIDHKINILDCHQSALSVDADKSSCTCEEAVFLLKLKNNGDYLESYDLSAEGPAKNYVTLDESTVILGPQEEKIVKAYSKAPCDVYGKYELTFKSKASTSLSIATVKAGWDIKPCYDYSISTPADYYSACDHSSLTIPLSIKNSGTADNNYNLKIDAPSWINLEKNTAAVSQSGTTAVNIFANTPYLTEGNFTIKTEVSSVTGNVKQTLDTKINVRKCYNVLADIDKETDRLCNAVSNKYEVRIKNLGEFSNTFDLTVSGAPWAELSESSITLNAGEEKILTLDIHPPYDADAKTYKITVQAKDPVSQASYSDSIDINVATTEQCYQPAINVKQESLEIMKDNAATDLIIIENKGTDNATYIVDLSGTASKFSEINPGIVTILPGKAEIIYLYIAPTLLTNAGDYEAIVTARMKDSTVLSSKTIQIKVNEKVEAKGNVTIETIPTEPKEGFFAKIGNGISGFAYQIGKFVSNLFTGIFTLKPEIKLAENITINELKEKFQSGDMNEAQLKEYFKQIGSESSADGLISQWKSELNITEDNQVAVLTENESAAIAIIPENETITEEAVAENVTVENVAVENTGTSEINEINVTIVTNETENETAITPENETVSEINITINETEVSENETSVTINITNESNEIITPSNESVNETIPSENASAEELNPSNELTNKFNFNFDFSKYKKYIIGAIVIILIMLLFITGFWKKIIEFFEEETETPANGKNGKK